MRSPTCSPWIRAALGAVAVASSCAVLADDADACRAAAGSFLTGVVLAQPTFAHGKKDKGVELSHTHLRLRGDGTGKTYDIAADNVFASGYAPRVEAVPAPLDTIRIGDKLELCGIPYQGGMHWVHTNCGDTPTRQDPDGWLKQVAADGSVGPNLEASQAYCKLWPRR